MMLPGFTVSVIYENGNVGSFGPFESREIADACASSALLRSDIRSARVECEQAVPIPEEPPQS